MTTTRRARTQSKRPPQLWLAGLAGQPAKRIRAAAGDLAEIKRFEPRDLPGQADYERTDPLAVFLDETAWKAMADQPPPWLAQARRVLVLEPGQDPAGVLDKGFTACLSLPLTKAKVMGALKAASQAREVYGDIERILGEAARERELVVRENGRLAFLQHMLARAMSSLDLTAVLSGIRRDLGLAFPVSEVLGVFWGGEAECEVFVPEHLVGQPREERCAYLLDLAARLRGTPSGAYRSHGVPGEIHQDHAQPGRALMVPLRHGEEVFGCLSVLIHRDLVRHEQDTARQAVAQLSPCLKNALEYLRLKRRADRDGLTGLPNRRSLDARLDGELRRHMRHREGFAVILADLDHFKKINDTHGHLAGDAALRHAAGVFEAGLRSTDFLARFGGEEFVAILPHTGQSQAWMLAERLRARLAAQELRYAGRVIPLTASLGLAAFAPGQAATPASLLAAADAAMYAAKRAGRNRVSMARTREDERQAARGEGGLLAG